MGKNVFESVWMSLALLGFSMMPLSAEEFGLFTYVENREAVEITDYPSTAVGDVEVPSEINSKPVTGIGDWAFGYCSQLWSVVIPESVTTIGLGAFKGCCVKSVVIPDSVTTISRWAFNACHRLESVVIGDSVTTIGYYAFSRCSLERVVIPDRAMTIG